MKLTDIQSSDKWVELEKEIHEKSNMSANVFGTDGVRISDFHKWPNRLCPAIKATSAGQSSICAVAHMNLAGEAMRTREPVIEECDAGLAKLVVPIFVEDEFVGAVGVCGLLMDDGEVDSFLVNKITEIDEEEVEKLSDDIKSVSSENLESLSQFICTRIDEITNAYKI